jgi:hypothetical protein
MLAKTILVMPVETQNDVFEEAINDPVACCNTPLTTNSSAADPKGVTAKAVKLMPRVWDVSIGHPAGLTNWISPPHKIVVGTTRFASFQSQFQRNLFSVEQIDWEFCVQMYRWMSIEAGICSPVSTLLASRSPGVHFKSVVLVLLRSFAARNILSSDMVKGNMQARAAIVVPVMALIALMALMLRRVPSV